MSDEDISSSVGERSEVEDTDAFEIQECRQPSGTTMVEFLDQLFKKFRVLRCLTAHQK